jgi:hypothetical protein
MLFNPARKRLDNIHAFAIHTSGGNMLVPILMASSAVVTLSACYVAWYYAQRAESARQYANKMCDFANGAWRDLTDVKRENDRLSDLVAKYQRNKPEREANGKFASKKKRVTAELAAYVASQRPL